jgi:hypothetical protein
MKKLFYAVVLFSTLSGTITIIPVVAEERQFTVMCYNVENLFDCIDDTTKRDEEYLPGGLRGWNYQKYNTKLWNIARVIVAAGAWEPPALIGLCEIESRKALEDLTLYSPLSQLKYKFVHFESPDARGIDVALLYQPQQFKPLITKPIAVSFPDAPDSKTRDVLYVKGLIPNADTLHVYVCHFPSRLGGETESEPRRVFVAGLIRSHIDSVFQASRDDKVLIMGDFNDYPDNHSMLGVLKALPPEVPAANQTLYNLMYPFHLSGKGTHMHEGVWGALDQIIVSGNLLNNNRFWVDSDNVRIFDAGFLLSDNEKHLGKQPFRTYNGFNYLGGFSDHLPVMAVFRYKEEY